MRHVVPSFRRENLLEMFSSTSAMILPTQSKATLRKFSNTKSITRACEWLKATEPNVRLPVHRSLPQTTILQAPTLKAPRPSTRNPVGLHLTLRRRRVKTKTKIGMLIRLAQTQVLQVLLQRSLTRIEHPRYHRLNLRVPLQDGTRPQQ